jgi:structural maintenance of chromosome 4
MNAQYIYNEKRLDSLKTASQPKADELRRMQELDGIISSEQAELERLTKCSSKLKDQASAYTQSLVCISRSYLSRLFSSHFHSLCFSVVT